MTRRNRFIQIVTASYMGGSLAWIFLSDRLLVVFADLASVVWLSTAKGIFFVVATTAMLFLALRAVPSARPRDGDALQRMFSAGASFNGRSRWLCYAFAVLIALTTLSVHDRIADSANNQTMMILLMFPVVLSATFGGLGPGLTATALTAVGVSHMVFEPLEGSGLAPGHEMFKWGLLIGNGVLISMLCGRLRHALATSEINRRLLDAVVSGTSDAVFVKDVEGRYLLVNEAAAQFVGKRPEEVLGRDDHSHFKDDIARGIAEIDKSILSQGGVRTFEERVVPLHGNEVIFLVTKGPVIDQDGRTVGVFGISRDITERHRAAAALAASKAALSEAQALAGVGAWEWNIGTDQHVWSEEIYRIYGRDMTLPAARFPEVQNYFTMESWDTLRAAVEEAIATGCEYCRDAEVIRSDGTHRWITARGKAIRDEHGAIVILRGTVQDITERKQAEESLRLSEQRFRRLFEQSPVAMGIVAPGGRMVDVNRQFIRLFGYKLDDIPTIDAWWQQAFPDVDCRQRAVENWKERTGSADGADFGISSEHAIACKDGTVRTVVVSGMSTGDTLLATFFDISQRKHAESQRDLLSEALRQSSHPLLLADDESRVTYVNPAFSRLFGYSLDALLGLPIGRLVPQTEDELKAHAEVIRTARIEGSWSGELERVTSTGARIPVVSNVGAISDERRRLVGFVVSYLDLRPLRERDSLLRKLSLAVEQSPESIVITNLDAEIEYVNAAFLRNTGYRREEVIGKRPSILRSGRTPPETFAALWQALQNGHPWKGELHNRRKDGSEYTDFAIIAPIRQPDGSISHYVSVQQDITEQRQIAEELGRYRDRLEDLVAERTQEVHVQTQSLRALIDNIPHLAWLKDRDGRYIAANRALADVRGTHASSLIGRTDAEIWPPAFAAQYRAEDMEVMISGRQKTTEGPLATSPDTLYETFKAPIIDSGGSVLGTVGFSRDILPQRRMEAELARRAEEAEAATRAKSVFLANMSHEIRTPMNAIMGMAELCVETALNERQHNCLAKIKSAADSLLRIIDDILDFSKIEAGRLSMECVPFMLGDVFDRLSAVTALRAEQQGIELGYVVCDDTLLLGGDPLRLGQVLTNLVTNALKFSTGGEVLVNVAHADSGDDWIELHFSVQDRGIGMSPEQLDGLFQPFHQADISTTRRFGGTGLGLAISRHLVERMSGRIWVESAPGAGSTFHFTARFDKLGQDRRSTSLALAAYIEESSASTVLIVDDNPVVRQLLSTVVAQIGLDACCAESVEAALTQVAELGAQSVLACLVDWHAPGTDGLEAIHQLRRSLRARQNPAAPIILVTDFAHQDALPPIGETVDGVLTKPIGAHHVRDELARCLGLTEASPPDLERRRQGGANWSRFDGLEVLLVEDTLINQEVMGELLKRAGISVKVAGNGVEAIEAITRGLPDLILMDCQMPVMDGYSAARRIRGTPAWAHVPIIALTANAMADDEEACYAAGMDAYISKPIRMEVLYDAFVQCLPDWHPTGRGAVAETFHPTPARLPSLPGIDAASGILHVGGIPALLGLLKQFRDGLGSSFVPDFQAACAARDHATAMRLAHSLKGVARTLGANTLGAAAADFEAELARQTSLADTAGLPHVLAELGTVLEGLAEIELVIEATGTHDREDTAGAHGQRSMIERLTVMLERFDTEAVAFAQEIEPMLSTSPQRNAWHDVRWHIERYDFDAALDALEALQQALAKCEDTGARTGS